MDKVKETLGKLLGGVKTKWNDIGRKGHVIFFSVAGVVIISAVIAIILATRTDYAVLYPGASAEEATEILAVVKNDLGATEVSVNGNGDIIVPKKEVENLRVQLSIKGYPKSTFNYDLWQNGKDLFSTESDKRVLEKQQLQENLRATLAMFDGVDSAVVILSIPETNDYVIGGSREEPSASVLLQINKELTNDTIKGIYNLVRTAVPGLKEDNISVTDGSGNLLSYDDMPVLAVDNDEEIELYYKRLEVQNSITDILKKELEKIFEGVFSDYRVGVNVQLNYDSEVLQSTEYTPSVDEEGNRGGMVSNENYVSGGGGVAQEGGLVGTTVDADISPDYPTLEVGEGSDFYYEWQKQINYLVNEEIRQVEKDGYSYDNISATVVVDATGLSQAEIEQWQGVIANAIGADFEKVSFMASPFMLDGTGGSGNLGGDGTVVVSGQKNSLIFAIITLGVLLVILLVIALVASGSGKKRAKARREGAMAATLHPNPAAPVDYEAEARREVNYDEPPEDFEIRSLTEDDGEETREAILKREIREFSKTNPEIVAQLIRTWMRNDE